MAVDKEGLAEKSQPQRPPRAIDKAPADQFATVDMAVDKEGLAEKSQPQRPPRAIDKVHADQFATIRDVQTDARRLLGPLLETENEHLLQRKIKEEDLKSPTVRDMLYTVGKMLKIKNESEDKATLESLFDFNKQEDRLEYTSTLKKLLKYILSAIPEMEINTQSISDKTKKEKPELPPKSARLQQSASEKFKLSEIKKNTMFNYLPAQNPQSKSLPPFKNR